jgi:hypothetical protein
MFGSFGESRLLVSWCAGGRCGMACSDVDRGRSRRPGAEDQGWSHRSGTRWPGGRVTPCAVCTWHVETRSVCFLVEPQNQGRRFLSGLASKPLGRFSPVWPQNWWRRFLPVWPQNRWSGFLVEPQNQGGGGFPGLSLKTGSSGLVIWASKSPRRFLGLGLKTKWASVCRLCHKTDEGRSARDTRRDLAACLVSKQV